MGRTSAAVRTPAWSMATPAPPSTRRRAPAHPWRRLRTVWNAIVGGIAAVVGLLPHVLHHVGLLAGTALVAGAGGTALFGVLGLAASVPLLLRLRRRFGTWRAPAVALAVFAVMFAISAFLIGPAIAGDGGGAGPAPAPSLDHDSHHP